MSAKRLWAVSLPAETIVAAMHPWVAAGHISHAHLPSRDAWGAAGPPAYIALHVADVAADLELLRPHTLRRGFDVTTAMSSSGPCWRLWPLVDRPSPPGGWPVLVRPASDTIVGILRLIGSVGHSERLGWPRWFFDRALELEGLEFNTDNYPCARPFELSAEIAAGVRAAFLKPQHQHHQAKSA